MHATRRALAPAADIGLKTARLAGSRLNHNILKTARPRGGGLLLAVLLYHVIVCSVLDYKDSDGYGELGFDSGEGA